MQNFIGMAPQVKLAQVGHFRVWQRNGFKTMGRFKQARHQRFLDTPTQLRLYLQIFAKPFAVFKRLVALSYAHGVKIPLESRGYTMNDWKKPEFVEIRMDAEINCYSSALADDPMGRVLTQPLIRDNAS